MYFGQFDSFSQAEDAAVSFTVSTKTVDGQTITSSAIPIDQLVSVLSEIDERAAAKQAWWQWNRTTKQIAVVPYELICSIAINLNDR